MNSVYSTVTYPNALEICSSLNGPVDFSTVNDIISDNYQIFSLIRNIRGLHFLPYHHKLLAMKCSAISK